MANRLKGSARPRLCQLPLTMQTSQPIPSARCNRKAPFTALSFYKSQGGETAIEKPCCAEHAMKIRNCLALTGERVKFGIFEVGAVVAAAHIANALTRKVKS